MLTFEEIKARAAPIFQKYGVSKAFLFGSFARDEQNTRSDIDFLVFYEPDAKQTLFKLAELQDELENAFSRKVDVIIEASISSYIKPYAIKDRKLIFKR